MLNAFSVIADLLVFIVVQFLILLLCVITVYSLVFFSVQAR